jgi:OFA family oxalate/formate antiporter-like MFS transporter
MVNAVAGVETQGGTKQMGGLAGNRWVQLVSGIIAMIVISNYQYAFTLFTPGIKQSFTGASTASIVAVFSAFILFETFPMPISGWFIDKFGIRKLMMFGSLCIGLGWLLGGTIAHSPFDLYLYYGVIAGTGAGIVYISCVANAIKWFPDKRGLAVGLTAAGFGGGAALTVIPIASSIHSMGWARAMSAWGIGQGIVAFIVAMILCNPPEGWAPAGWVYGASQAKKTTIQSKVNYTWIQTLAKPEFYFLYVMFFFAALGGLIVSANLSQIAKSLGVSNAKLWGVAIVPLAVAVAAICNASARVLWGWVSDWLGREFTMFLAFGAQAILVIVITQVAGSPIAFLVLVAMIFLFWGAVFSLFSATTGDIFGAKHASVNYGMVYTAKGFAALVAGFGAAAIAAYFAGSYKMVFVVAGILCGIAALLSVLVLKPLIRSRIEKEY